MKQETLDRAHKIQRQIERIKDLEEHFNHLLRGNKDLSRTGIEYYPLKFDEELENEYQAMMFKISELIKPTFKSIKEKVEQNFKEL